MIDLEKVRPGALIGAVVALILGIVVIMGMICEVGSNEYVVIQSAFTGDLSCYTQPGPVGQWFGRVTKYPRRSTYDFSHKDTRKTIRFNDGGHGYLYGSISWEMPSDCKSIIALHKTFGSAEGVDTQAVSKMIDSAIFLTGPLMSSTESSGERRTELVQDISDQAENGVYQTEVLTKDVTDPLSGEKKTANVVQIMHDAKGNVLRQQSSVLTEFGIRLLPLSINNIVYEDAVEKQIQARQRSITDVQIAMANARKAEQDAITIEKQGEATAAQAKWAQEKVKATEVTKAQQELEVQQLNTQKAALFKQQQILEGEGVAEAKRLAMQANGALDAKLEAYVKVQGLWADAFAKYSGNMVPQINMGGSSGSSMANAQGLMELLTAKTAKDLGIDMSIEGKKH
jgi:hypothetical protein